MEIPVKNSQPMAELATVRRFEAAGFRAWPAGTVHYDGTWVLRLTEGHAAKRLNSVNPLDPGDTHNLGERIARAAQRFDAFVRPLTFRLSPLSGEAISRHLDAEGWETLGQSIVMQLPLDDDAVHGAMDQIPMKDMGRFVDAALNTQSADPTLRSGLLGIIGAIQPEAGLFVLESDEAPMATAICVHDGDLAGLFEIATDAAERGKGFGRRIALSALKWARLRGAQTAWLQVEAGNEAAQRLYGSLGFAETYRYHYRRPRL